MVKYNFNLLEKYCNENNIHLINNYSNVKINRDTKIDEKSIQSHYFIKFTNGKSITDNINKLSTITYDFNNTVGPKSISKQELIFKFNPLLEC